MHLRHRDVFQRQQLTNRSIAFLSLLSVVTVLLMPAEAVAFEAQLSTAVSTRLVMPVELADRPEDTPRKLEGRDPYLTQAIDSLPDYHYTEAGSTLAATSPVTVVAQPAPTKLAVVPIQPVSPTPGAPLVLEGEASYYSRAGCLGCDPLRIMANGQPLNDSALTMAIGADKKHLVGRRAQVTSLVTGKSVAVTITDTGGFHQARYGSRVADLTVAAKEAIGMQGGVGQVRVEVY